MLAIPKNQHDPRTNYYWIQAYFVTIYMEAASCWEKFKANDTHLMGMQYAYCVTSLIAV